MASWVRSILYLHGCSVGPALHTSKVYPYCAVSVIWVELRWEIRDHLRTCLRGCL